MRLRRDILRLRSRLRLTSIFVRLRRDLPSFVPHGRRVGPTRLHFVSAWQASDELRRASNEATLRAFRNTEHFLTLDTSRE